VKNSFDLTVIMPILLLDYHLYLMTLICIQNLRFVTYPYNFQLIIFHNVWKLHSLIKDDICGENDIYIPLEKSEKVTKLYNQGIKMAKSEYILLLGNDTLLQLNWFEYGKKALDENKCDIFIPWLYKQPIDYYSSLEKAKSNDYIYPVSFVDSGCACQLFTKKTYNDIGPFDENMPVWWDREYKYRIDSIAHKRVASDLRCIATTFGPMTRNSENIGDYFNVDIHNLNDENEYMKRKWGLK